MRFFSEKNKKKEIPSSINGSMLKRLTFSKVKMSTDVVCVGGGGVQGCGRQVCDIENLAEYRYLIKYSNTSPITDAFLLILEQQWYSSLTSYWIHIMLNHIVYWFGSDIFVTIFSRHGYLFGEASFGTRLYFLHEKVAIFKD